MTRWPFAKFSRVDEASRSIDFPRLLEQESEESFWCETHVHATEILLSVLFGCPYIVSLDPLSECFTHLEKLFLDVLPPPPALEINTSELPVEHELKMFKWSREVLGRQGAINCSVSICDAPTVYGGGAGGGGGTV